MKITDYSRDNIKQFVQDGICPIQTLRDYDLLKQIENGEKITHVANAHNICYMQAKRIRDKYLPHFKT
jgi:hypothetical protein